MLVKKFNVVPDSGFIGNPHQWRERLAATVRSNFLQMELYLSREGINNIEFRVTGNELSLSLIRSRGGVPSAFVLDHVRTVRLSEKELSKNKLVLTITADKNLNIFEHEVHGGILRKEEGSTTITLEMTIDIENLTGFIISQPEEKEKTIAEKMIEKE